MRADGGHVTRRRKGNRCPHGSCSQLWRHWPAASWHRPPPRTRPAHTVVEIGTFGGPFSDAKSLNLARQVVGNPAGSVFFHPFVYRDGAMVDLGTFGGNAGEALGINNDGDIVGWAMVPDGTLHAFVSIDGVKHDLNSEINDPSWLLAMAWDINDRGDIVGWGLKNGRQRGFLLTVPEPGAGAAALVVALQALRRRRRRCSSITWPPSASTGTSASPSPPPPAASAGGSGSSCPPRSAPSAAGGASR